MQVFKPVSPPAWLPIMTMIVSALVGADGVVPKSFIVSAVTGNVALAVDAVHGARPKAERAQRVAKYVAMVGLSHAATRRPAELSGGMRQRVAVARALAMEPEVLLMDEPLSALDALTRADLADEIERIWRAEKKTAVLITNDVDEAITLAERILILNPDGRLGTAFQVDLPRPRDRRAMTLDVTFQRLRADITATLLQVGVQAKVVATRNLPAPTPRHGRTPRHALSRAYAAAARGHADARYLEYSQLTKVFDTRKGPLTVVDRVDLTLKKGEFVSLIGHSGCGKSTVLSMTAGLTGITQDVIVLDGLTVEGPDPERAVVFQSPSLFPWLTARENVAIGVDQVYPTASQAERQEVVEYCLERVGRADAMHKPAAERSNGMRRGDVQGHRRGLPRQRLPDQRGGCRGDGGQADPAPVHRRHRGQGDGGHRGLHPALPRKRPLSAPRPQMGGQGGAGLVPGAGRGP